MLRRGLHQPVARSRSHKKLGFERPTPFSSQRAVPQNGRKRTLTGECTSHGPSRVLIKQEIAYVYPKNASRPRSAEAQARLTGRLPPLPRERGKKRKESQTSYAIHKGPRRARRIGPERRRSATLGSTTVRVIHADDEERGAARPPERVPRTRHEDDAAGHNGGLRGCYSMPPRATEEDVPASSSASSSSASSPWRRRDPTRWRKASPRRVLRVLIEGQILTKRGQPRR